MGRTKRQAIVTIPDIWLVGRTFMLRKIGYGYLEAYKRAVEQWQEQEELERRFLSQKETTPC